MKFTAQNPQELADKTYEVLKNHLSHQLVIGLSADLGAGKTTLIQFLGRRFGIKELITSPTFNLRKVYPLEDTDYKHFQHIDLYRFEKIRPSDMQEIEEWMKSDDSITFVEWIDRIEGYEKLINCLIRIKILEDDSREVEITWS